MSVVASLLSSTSAVTTSTNPSAMLILAFGTPPFLHRSTKPPQFLSCQPRRCPCEGKTWLRLQSPFPTDTTIMSATTITATLSLSSSSWHSSSAHNPLLRVGDAAGRVCEIPRRSNNVIKTTERKICHAHSALSAKCVFNDNDNDNDSDSSSESLQNDGGEDGYEKKNQVDRIALNTNGLNSSFVANEVTNDENLKEEEEFLQRELKRLEKLEAILAELEEFASLDDDYEDEADYDDDRFDMQEKNDDNRYISIDQDVLLRELLESFPDDDYDDGVGFSGEKEDVEGATDRVVGTESSPLEAALLQGVVPADAGVGSGQLPGDFGFDPLNVSTRDYIQAGQEFVVNLLLPFSTKSVSPQSSAISEKPQQRPRALILRDYRESEIRHGRLAMLAAMIWPLEEMLDQLVLEPDQLGSLLFSRVRVTLPYFPLFMTAVMILLGYLDIYSAAIKDMDQIGEAFLPGDCFWDPLRVLDGAPARMKRNMQERELFNGRVAMLAFAIFIWEETTTRKPLISIPANELLFKPLYQVSFIQEYLEAQFTHSSASLDYFPDSLN